MIQVDIGGSKISVPEGHSLPDIYENNIAYDFMPWNIIGSLLVDNHLLSMPLVDIGANIGDSVAHFRRFSQAQVVSVEADARFFEVLEINMRQFRDVTCINSLVCPAHMVGKVSFTSGSQTGTTKPTASVTEAWEGRAITLEDLLTQVAGDCIFKSDTDGFDSEIVGDLCRIIQSTGHGPPIVFFEGANAEQIVQNRFESFITVTNTLQEIGYEILLLANSGLPYAYAGKLKDTVRSSFESLSLGYKIGRALCHYLDILAVKDHLITTAIRSRFPALKRSG